MDIKEREEFAPYLTLEKRLLIFNLSEYVIKFDKGQTVIPDRRKLKRFMGMNEDSILHINKNIPDINTNNH